MGWRGGKQNYYGSIWIVLVAQIQVWNPYLLEFGGGRTQNLAASICPDVELLHMPPHPRFWRRKVHDLISEVWPHLTSRRMLRLGGVGGVVSYILIGKQGAPLLPPTPCRHPGRLLREKSEFERD